MASILTHSIVLQREIGPSETARYLSLGNAGVKRKFDTTFFPDSSSWDEIWVGFRWRIGNRTGSITAFTGSNADIYGSSIRFYAGICDTSKMLIGETGSLTSNAVGSCWGFGINTETIAGTILYVQTSSNNRAFISLQHYNLQRFNTLAGNFTASNLISPVTPFITICYDPPQDCSMIMRFHNVNNPAFNQMEYSFVYPSITSLSSHTSASFLPEVMKQSSWAGVVSKAATYNYTDDSGGTTGVINWTGSGGWYPDGVFITSNNKDFPIDINDIVIRII